MRKDELLLRIWTDGPSDSKPSDSLAVAELHQLDEWEQEKSAEEDNSSVLRRSGNDACVVPESPVQASDSSVRAIEQRNLEARVGMLESTASDMRTNSELRAKMAFAIPVGGLIWVTAVFVLVCVDAVCSAVVIDPTVLSTMVGATSLSIVGLIGVVVRYLFNHNPVVIDGSRK